MENKTMKWERVKITKTKICTLMKNVKYKTYGNYRIKHKINNVIIIVERRKEMSKIAVVFWSGTGNTGVMATNVAEGAKEAGAEVDVIYVSDFSADKMDDYDAIAFGCPSMGAEQLEESEFEPVFLACEPKLNGKKIALFGSYGWGDGEWMRNWEETCKNDGAVLATDFVICNEAPDDDAIEQCKALGKALV